MGGDLIDGEQRVNAASYRPNREDKSWLEQYEPITGQINYYINVATGETSLTGPVKPTPVKAEQQEEKKLPARAAQRPLLPGCKVYTTTNSQYTLQATSACTPCAVEAALLLLAGHEPSVGLAEAAVMAGQAYKGDAHLDLNDVVGKVERYKLALSQGEIMQCTFDDLLQLMNRIQRVKRERKARRVAATLVKSGETILVALTNDVPNRWVLFDSHKRPAHEGAAFLTFPSMDDIMGYISSIWHSMDFGGGGGLMGDMYNMVEMTFLHPSEALEAGQGSLGGLPEADYQAFNPKEVLMPMKGVEEGRDAARTVGDDNDAELQQTLARSLSVKAEVMVPMEVVEGSGGAAQIGSEPDRDDYDAYLQQALARSLEDGLNAKEEATGNAITSPRKHTDALPGALTRSDDDEAATQRLIEQLQAEELKAQEDHAMAQAIQASYQSQRSPFKTKKSSPTKDYGREQGKSHTPIGWVVGAAKRRNSSEAGGGALARSSSNTSNDGGGAGAVQKPRKEIFACPKCRTITSKVVGGPLIHCTCRTEYCSRCGSTILTPDQRRDHDEERCFGDDSVIVKGASK